MKRQNNSHVTIKKNKTNTNLIKKLKFLNT